MVARPRTPPQRRGGPLPHRPHRRPRSSLTPEVVGPWRGAAGSARRDRRGARPARPRRGAADAPSRRPRGPDPAPSAPVVVGAARAVVLRPPSGPRGVVLGDAAVRLCQGRPPWGGRAGAEEVRWGGEEEARGRLGRRHAEQRSTRGGKAAALGAGHSRRARRCLSLARGSTGEGGRQGRGLGGEECRGERLRVGRTAGRCREARRAGGSQIRGRASPGRAVGEGEGGLAASVRIFCMGRWRRHGVGAGLFPCTRPKS